MERGERPKRREHGERRRGGSIWRAFRIENDLVEKHLDPPCHRQTKRPARPMLGFLVN